MRPALPLPLAAAVLALSAGALEGCAPADAPEVLCPASDGKVAVIIQLAERVDVDALVATAPAPGAALGALLAGEAERTQAPLRAFLASHGAGEVRPLPILNAVAARVPPQLLAELSRFPGVAGVREDRLLAAPAMGSGTASAPGWNLTAIGAPQLWAAGIRGSGVVVANMDTGVDLAHLDLQARWRGGSDSWFDPFESTATPFDPIGHGTQTMGILVGGAASGTPIGVAPDATWIAARIYDRSGNTSASVIHQAFQWLLDPDGDPSTDDAPRVVLASWGEGSAGSCDPEFEPDLTALRAAGIAVVFAAGNSGPAGSSSVSPANNPGAFSSGAVDPSDVLAGFSSRGPSACTGGIFPELVAPGVNVLTADLSLSGQPQYATVSGTSYAAPHVAGAEALLLSAHPSLSPAQLEDALRGSAKDLGEAGPDDLYGHGRLDVAAALARIEAPPADAGTPVEISDRWLPLARVGWRYTRALQVVPASPAVWTVTSGALPNGISLQAESGMLEGAPKEEGLFPFTVRAETAQGSAEKALTLRVLPSRITSFSPTGTPRCPPR